MASGEDDLVATMEGLFAASEARVITAYKVTPEQRTLRNKALAVPV